MSSKMSLASARRVRLKSLADIQEAARVARHVKRFSPSALTSRSAARLERKYQYFYHLRDRTRYKARKARCERAMEYIERQLSLKNA